MISAKDAHTYMQQAIAAIASGDLDAELAALRKARAVLAVVPDSDIDDNEMTYSRESIDRMIQDAERRKAAGSSSSSPVTFAKVVYQTPQSSTS